MIIVVGKIGEPLPAFLISKPEKEYIDPFRKVKFDVKVVTFIKESNLLCQICNQKQRTVGIQLSSGIRWEICETCYNTKTNCSVCEEFRIAKIGQGRLLKNADYFICADCIITHGKCECGELGLFLKDKKVVCQNCYKDDN